MPFKPRTMVMDGVSGWFDLAVAAQLGDEPKPMTYTALKYGPLLGGWHRDVRVMREIQRRHGILFGVVGHIEHREDWVTVGYDAKHQPIRQGEIKGWQLAVPGQGEKTIRAAFSEVWHLTAIANEYGSNPVRKLYTCDHIWEGHKFEAKSRKGIVGPVTNPTWDSVMKALPQGKNVPESVLLLGVPGVGKTTFWESAPKPILFIDAMGGCEESAKKEGIKVIYPKSTEEIFEVLRTLRDKGELP